MRLHICAALLAARHKLAEQHERHPLIERLVQARAAEALNAGRAARLAGAVGDD